MHLKGVVPGDDAADNATGVVPTGVASLRAPKPTLREYRGLLDQRRLGPAHEWPAVARFALQVMLATRNEPPGACMRRKAASSKTTEADA